LSNSTTTLNLPLNTPIKLFEYTFSQSYTLGQLAASNRLVVASSEIATFTISEDTTELNLSSKLVPAATPTSINLSSDATQIGYSETVQYQAVATYTDESQQNLTSILDWSVSDQTKATVSNSNDSRGLVTGVKSGIIKVTASHNATVGEAELQIGSPPVLDAGFQNLTINEDTLKIFSKDDFYFSDADSGDELTKVKIADFSGSGVLFFDSNDDNVAAEAEKITAELEISMSDIHLLKFLPEVDTYRNAYASFNFMLYDGGFYSESDYPLSIDVSAINDTPVISPITTQTKRENTIPTISFTVDDVDSSANALVLAGSSSNTALVANSNIQFGGSGENRTATFTPGTDEIGTTSIVITVDDGNSSSDTTFDLEFQRCTTKSNGPILDTNIYAGTLGCGDLLHNIVVKAGHTVIYDSSDGPYSGSILIEPGGDLITTGSDGTLSGDIVLAGGKLDIDSNITLSGNISLTTSSSISIQNSKELTYLGEAINIGSNELTLSGNGDFTNTAALVLDNADAVLNLNDAIGVANVTIGSADINPGKGINVNGNCIVQTLEMQSNTIIDVNNGDLTIADTLMIAPASDVKLELSGTAYISDIELWGSLEIISQSTGGTPILLADATLEARANATFSIDNDYVFDDGLVVDSGVTLIVDSPFGTTTVTISGGAILNGNVTLENDTNLVFKDPTIDQNEIDSQITNNGTGTISNDTDPSDTDLTALTAEWESVNFCDRNGGCQDLEDAVLKASPLNRDWFLEVNIDGQNYNIQFEPKSDADLLNGRVLGRKVDTNGHYLLNSPYIYLGNYSAATVNSAYQGIIIKAGSGPSFVSWFEEGHLYNAQYDSATIDIARYMRDPDSDDLFVYFNHDMDMTSSQVDGISTSFNWVDSKTFKIALSGIADDQTLSLPTTAFYTDETTPQNLVVNWSYTIKRFVMVAGNIVDKNNNPIQWVNISSDLDAIQIYSDSGGDFSLATVTQDPLNSYLLFLDAGCSSTGVEVSGLNLTGLQFTSDCEGSSPVNVDYTKHQTSTALSPSSGTTWLFHSTGDIEWDESYYTSSVSVYILKDDTANLDSSDAQTLADNVNQKYWKKLFTNITNDGIVSFDPSHFGETGQALRILIIDEEGNWDITDADFAINIVDSSYYQPNAISYPIDGTEVWLFGTPVNITWNNKDLGSKTVSIYTLHDDSSGLETTDDNTLTDIINDKRWEIAERVRINTGEFYTNPQHLGSNGSQSRILILDADGNWDICDEDFTINMVSSTNYHQDALIAPNGGETWAEDTTETISWDSNLLDTEWVSFYVLKDDTSNLEKTNNNLADVVNSRKWGHRHSDSFDADSTADGIARTIVKTSYFAENGSNSRILAIDDAGNWDISDNDFTVYGNTSPSQTPTDLSDLTHEWDSDYFCSDQGECIDLAGAIRKAKATGHHWFAQTNINGSEYSVQFEPDDPDNVLTSGKVYGRELNNNDNHWVNGSSYQFIGSYEYVTVNSAIDGILIKAGDHLSMVTWFDNGHLYHANYYSDNVYVNGCWRDESDNLFVYFNHDMNMGMYQVDGLTPTPSPLSWPDSKTFEIPLATYADNLTLSLPTESFETTNGTPISETWDYEIQHFVTISGTVVDNNGVPVWAQISSDLDDSVADNDANGDFTLATLTQDPADEYILYVSGNCDDIGYQASGLNPTGIMITHGCDGGSSVSVDPSKYDQTGLSVPSATGVIWHHHIDTTISWSTSVFPDSNLTTIYFLEDDASGLDETDPTNLANNVNNKSWTKHFTEFSNTAGVLSFDPAHFDGDHRDGLRILIVDEAGNWDISDNDFSIHLVNPAQLQSSAVIAPDTGTEVWFYGQNEIIECSNYV